MCMTNYSSGPLAHRTHGQPVQITEITDNISTCAGQKKAIDFSYIQIDRKLNDFKPIRCR